MPSKLDSRKIEQSVSESRKRRIEFIERVRREEVLANQDPKRYRRKVVGLIALSYTYILTMLVFTLGILVLLIVLTASNPALIKLTIIAGIFCFAVIRSLWVKIEPPGGMQLQPEDSPELFAEVRSIADRLQAPHPDEIRIDYQFNASAVQTPRLGVFGFYRNILMLGMPLMVSLSKDELRAVIAHEFGHFSGSHGKLGVVAYRVDRSWQYLQAQFATGRVKGGSLLGWFARWFYPRFAAATFALRRANEYEADSAAAAVAGSQNAATGLMRISFLPGHIEANFWSPLNAELPKTAAPPIQAFVDMPTSLAATPDPDLVARRLQIALAEKTDYDDTHPCLTDRLQSLGRLPASFEDALAEVVHPLDVTAAEAYFGPRLPTVLARLGQTFANENAAQWARRHRAAVDKAHALEAIERKPEDQRTEDDWHSFAGLTYELKSSEEAEPVLQRLSEAHPEDPQFAFLLGAHLADREDPAAETYLRRAIGSSRELSDAAVQILGKLFYDLGEFEKLDNLRAMFTELRHVRQIIDEEALRMTLKDDLVAHSLKPEKLQLLIQELSAVPKLQKAYLVEKRLLEGESRFVLIVFHRRRGFELRSEPQKLVNSIRGLKHIPAGSTIYAPEQRRRWMKRLNKIPNALIVDR